MGLQPNIARKRDFSFKTCSRCGQSFSASNFAPTKSIFYPDGLLPICNDCVQTFLEQKEFRWVAVDKICQYADIPFIPKEWDRLYEMNGAKTFPIYAEVFQAQEYEGLGWGDYYEAFKELREKQEIEEHIPLLEDERKKYLKERWGANYDDEALNYLENLYNGMTNTQNVNGALQIDQAVKICKMSYEIDCRIREGADFDKLLASYDKLVKTAEFTPKNVKNINDFDSVGELIKWLEKKGWRNKFYDNVTRDVVDETIKNIQNFNQRLYANESGIGEEITRRIEALKSANQLERNNTDENYYGTDITYDPDVFENEGYEGLFANESDEFFVELDRGEDNG